MSTTNTTVRIIESIIHVSFVDVGAKAATAAAISAVPFLGLPVIKQVFEFIVTKFCEFVSKHSQTAAADAIIQAQTDAQADRYKEALKELDEAQLSGDPNAKSDAKKKYAEKMRDLVRYNRTSGR
jgi:hypothetical protein